MPDDQPERRSAAAIAELFDVPRNAKIGFSVGALLAVAAYAYRIAALAGPVSATRGSPLLFLLLAFVLAVSTGVLVTVLLSARSALRVAREGEG